MRRPTQVVSRARHAALVAALGGLLLSTGCVDEPTEHRVRANAYLRGGDAKQALEEIDLGLQKSAKDLPLLILKGKALFELERYDEARAAFTQAVDTDASQKELGEAQLGLAMIAMRAKDWPEARKRFEALVAINDGDGDAHINLARICLQTEDLPCALQHGEAAVHTRGRSEDVLFTLGRIYISAKKYDDARTTFNRICEVVAQAASCPYGLALVAAQEGDKATALAKLKEAIDRKLPSPDKLGEDPMLAPLKDDADFKKLVADAAKG